MARREEGAVTMKRFIIINFTLAVIIVLTLLVRSPMRDSEHIQEGMIKTNGVELYTKIVGRGEPVVILHGGPGLDHIHMLPFQILADQCQVIFYDQRAAGNSTGAADAASITVANFVEDLEGLRENLNLDKIHLLGHSWGASLALHYAVKYPWNLASLILLSPSAGSQFNDQFFRNIQSKTSPQDREILKKISESEEFRNSGTEAIQKYYRISIKPFFYDPAKADLLDLNFGKNTYKNQSKVASLLFQNLGTYDLHPRLSVINCPVLIIHGDSDPLPVEAAYTVHKSIAESRIIILKNSGHFTFIESPQEVFSALRSFLRDDESVQSSIPPDIERRLNAVKQ
ncbi:MAG: alpha/beta fold hydrolase [Calditrichia bacterium]